MSHFVHNTIITVTLFIFICLQIVLNDFRRDIRQLHGSYR